MEQAGAGTPEELTGSRANPKSAYNATTQLRHSRVTKSFSRSPFLEDGARVTLSRQNINRTDTRILRRSSLALTRSVGAVTNVTL